MMMFFYSYSFVMLFLASMFVFVSKYKHFLMMLLSLEAMVLSVYAMLFFYFIQFSSESFLSMIYLALSVCEGALGLSLLVILIRTHGSDMVLMFDNLW